MKPPVIVGAAILLSASAAAEEPFAAKIDPIGPAARERMRGVSWTEGCPIGPDDLSVLLMSYWGFDAAPHRGQLVVHRKLADEMVAIFHDLYEARFPIARMQPYEDFAVAQYAAADDTVGFYCRPDQGDPSKLGMHSYGFAIDINPRENPYLDRHEGWWPAGSAANSAREEAPGRITLGSPIFALFARHGWVWGGLSHDGPDYMHFEKGAVGAHPNPAEAPYLVDSVTYQPPKEPPHAP